MEIANIRGLLFDLDGTVYRGGAAIPGAADFFRQLQLPYLFVTNRANRTPREVAEQLRNMGIRCNDSNILTSAEAAAEYLPREASVFILGEVGLLNELERRNCRIAGSDEPTPDAVVVSYDRSINYEKITQATRYIIGGARFVATNDDTIITVEDGVLPEAGPLVAAVANATSKKPELVGKPHRPIMDLALKRLGMSSGEVGIVGDNLSTDIMAGKNSSLFTILILTGVSTWKDVQNFHATPDLVVSDYAELSQALSIR